MHSKVLEILGYIPNFKKKFRSHFEKKAPLIWIGKMFQI